MPRTGWAVLVAGVMAGIMVWQWRAAPTTTSSAAPEPTAAMVESFVPEPSPTLTVPPRVNAARSDGAGAASGAATQTESPWSSRRLAEDFEGEPIDDNWAPRAESLIYQHLVSSDLALSGYDVECRTKTCRLELRHLWDEASRDQPQLRIKPVRAMTTRLTEAGSPDVQSVRIQIDLDPNQTVPTTTVWVFREGTQSSVDMRLVPTRVNSSGCDSPESCREMFEQPSYEEAYYIP